MAKYRITVKNKLYNGVTEGVLFQNGEAVVEDEKIKNVLVNDYGYVCEEIEENEPKKKEK